MQGHIQKMISELGIKTIIKKKRPYYKKEIHVILDNHVNKGFSTLKPKDKCVTYT